MVVWIVLRMKLVVAKLRLVELVSSLEPTAGVVQAVLMTVTVVAKHQPVECEILGEDNETGCPACVADPACGCDPVCEECQECVEGACQDVKTMIVV